MTKFNIALRWLREGEKVSRPCWNEGSYWRLGPEEAICWSDGRAAHIHLNQIEANDWEIYKEPEDWTCSKCGKKYKTYAVILDDNPLSISCELEVRGQYYNQRLKKGLCEKCSKEIIR